MSEGSGVTADAPAHGAVRSDTSENTTETGLYVLTELNALLATKISQSRLTPRLRGGVS